MKKILILFMITIVVFMGLQSCDDKEEVTYYNTVGITPRTVKNGEVVKFSLGKVSASGDGISIDVSSSSSIIVNGKDVIKSISYFVNGEFAASSSNKANYYEVEYTIENMAPGEYEVTARCESNSKNYTIKEYITPATFIVE